MLLARFKRCSAAAAILMALLLVGSKASGGPYDPAIYIYGIHTWSAGANGVFNGKRGWTTEVIWTKPQPEPPFNLQVSQAQQIVNENLQLIVRLDYDYAEPIPASSAAWDTFASQCAAKVNQFKPYCRIWIIGNEMNASFLTSVPASTACEVYRRCRTAIRAVQPDAIVVVPAVAPWNSGRNGAGPYSSAWLNYMYEMVNTLGADADGYALHAYGGRSGDADPRDDSDWGFGVFHRWMEIIDANAWASNSHVYLTEFNHAADGGSGGYPAYAYPAQYINKAFEAVNTWNVAHAHRIKCACWFSYANGGFPGYNIAGNSTMQSDFSYTTANTSYVGTIMGAADWAMYE